jgi:Thioesterase-like superfamily
LIYSRPLVSICAFGQMTWILISTSTTADICARRHCSRALDCPYWRVLGIARQQKAFPVIGDAIAKFRHDLKVFQSFEIHTRLIGWDRKWGFLEHRFVRVDRVMEWLPFARSSKVLAAQSIRKCFYPDSVIPSRPRSCRSGQSVFIRVGNCRANCYAVRSAPRDCTNGRDKCIVLQPFQWQLSLLGERQIVADLRLMRSALVDPHQSVAPSRHQWPLPGCFRHPPRCSLIDPLLTVFSRPS